jgi:hypothetical protein
MAALDPFRLATGVQCPADACNGQGAEGRIFHGQYARGALDQLESVVPGRAEPEARLLEGDGGSCQLLWRPLRRRFFGSHPQGVERADDVTSLALCLAADEEQIVSGQGAHPVHLVEKRERLPVGINRLMVGQEGSGPFGGEDGVAVSPGSRSDRDGLEEVVGQCVHMIVKPTAVHCFERLTYLKVNPDPP